jgi:hypothetical protein
MAASPREGAGRPGGQQATGLSVRAMSCLGESFPVWVSEGDLNTEIEEISPTYADRPRKCRTDARDRSKRPVRPVGPGLLVVGAKWGAMNGRHRAIQDLLYRSIPLICQVLSNDQLHQPTAGISFASRGSEVRIPSAPLRNCRSDSLFEFLARCLGARSWWSCPEGSCR